MARSSRHIPGLSRRPTSWPRSGAAFGAGRSFHSVRSSGLLGFLGSRDHLVPQSGLRRLIAEHTTYERIEEMPIEFHVVAVDVLTG